MCPIFRNQGLRSTFLGVSDSLASTVLDFMINFLGVSDSSASTILEIHFKVFFLNIVFLDLGSVFTDFDLPRVFSTNFLLFRTGGLEGFLLCHFININFLFLRLSRRGFCHGHSWFLINMNDFALLLGFLNILLTVLASLFDFLYYCKIGVKFSIIRVVFKFIRFTEKTYFVLQLIYPI
jgi:hypothetical protein